MRRDHVRRTRLHEQVADALIDRIVNGDFEPGQALPSEVELAKEFDVSRIVVRQALQTAENYGLVTIRHGVGAVVSKGNSRAVTETLKITMRWQRHTMAELVEVRSLLETQTAALAAERATEDDIAFLQETIDRVRRRGENLETYIQADMDFHLGLARATGNSLLPLLQEPLQDLLWASRAFIFSRGRGNITNALLDHERILKAIAERDVEASRQAMQEHISRISIQMKESIDPNSKERSLQQELTE